MAFLSCTLADSDSMPWERRMGLDFFFLFLFLDRCLFPALFGVRSSCLVPREVNSSFWLCIREHEEELAASFELLTMLLYRMRRD